MLTVLVVIMCMIMVVAIIYSPYIALAYKIVATIVGMLLIGFGVALAKEIK